MAAKWTNDELTVLTQNLVDGFPVQRMKELIPSRESGGAIQLKAQGFDYGVTTSKVDGIKRFYAGLKHRQGEVRVAATNDVEVPVAVEVPTIQVEPRRIIANSGLQANSIAIRMLTEYNLSVDPDIVRCLSIHILGGEL